ncbi:MAG: hypothetical protein ACPGQQ_08760, partial [Candidatus Puniceispirillaceae bacterium]
DGRGRQAPGMGCGTLSSLSRAWPGMVKDSQDTGLERSQGRETQIPGCACQAVLQALMTASDKLFDGKPQAG